MNTAQQSDKNSGSRLLQTVFYGLALKKNHQLRSVGSVWGAGRDSTPTEPDYKIAEQLRFTDVIQQPDNTAFQSARAPGLMNY